MPGVAPPPPLEPPEITAAPQVIGGSSGDAVPHASVVGKTGCQGPDDEKEPLQAAADPSPKKTAAMGVRLQGFLLQILSSFFLTSMISLAKLLEGSHAPVSGSAKLKVLQVVLLRSLVVVVFALSVLAYDGESPLGRPACQPVLLCRGLLGALAVISMLYAVALMPLTEVVVLTFTMPLWGAIFGRLFLNEPLSKSLAWAFLICGAGVMLIAQPWAHPSVLASETGEFPYRRVGIIVALAQAAFSAGAKTCVRVLGKSGYHPQVIVMYLTVFGTGISAAVLFGLQRDAVLPATWQWAVLLLIGICAFGTQTTSTMALRSITVAEGAMVNYLNLVWSEVYSVLAFRELPNWSSAAGAGLIVICTLLLLALKR